jgi:hypothetical protein
MPLYGNVTIRPQDAPQPGSVPMKLLRDISVLISAAELGNIVGIDIETVNNWLRHGIITRAQIGRRQLRSRLFSTDEVYKVALTNELVNLGISPSPASDATNAVWNVWAKKDTPEGWKIYGLALPNKDKWTVELCSRKASGGPLYKLGKSTGSKSIVEVDLPRQASALIPISDVFDRVSSKLAELLG